LSCIEANILKQEMLSLGGDVAVARDTLTGKIKKTDCLIMGTLSQYNRLKEKLNNQPFGLSRLAVELSRGISNYQRSDFSLNLGRYKFKIKEGKAYICAIVNLTPDSFSGDGFYKTGFVSSSYAAGRIADSVEKMVEQGADMVDIGAESTRPQAKPVSLKDELARSIPVIKKLAKRIKVPISIDTYKPEVAQAALDNGVSVINDISGFRDSRMLKVASGSKCGIVIMHCKGTPRNMQNNPRYACVIEEIIGYLDNAVKKASGAGISRERIIVDPGIGFGKTAEHNLEIVKNLKEFKVLGQPVLIGVSRKSFIGKVLNSDVNERLYGTLAANIWARKNGASFLRVHDVSQTKQAVQVIDAIENI